MTSTTKNAARGGRSHGGAWKTDRLGSVIIFEDATSLARLQASRLVLTFGLLPDTAAALACLIYGGVS